MDVGLISGSSIKGGISSVSWGEENTLFTQNGRTAGTGRVYPATKNYATKLYWSI